MFVTVKHYGAGSIYILAALLNKFILLKSIAFSYSKY